ncbi:SIR2 family protein [Peribacillus simplex]|uniref:SIR2 family NAD-dependent protein deacylase n=1 Tax=Peribacillus simplex TaxID=1478 RepID=UPI00298E4856|nr:SIR2 family protein [Peribacillus simplex]MDW7615203.1 SIR2 family protein [Peribacillus simplex]
MSANHLFEKKLKMYHHLSNIRDRLWSEDGKSRVSVMVGAGFSLNAEKIEDTFESMSLWADLKNKVSAGLRRDLISDCEDVLTLGQLYAEEYGRANLDELLKQAIPDQNYEPSEIHQSLLRLPWADVYTTNYDTLLERTLANVFERSYQVIYDINDIPSSVPPRIIKLHGSFPSKRPFIFTKKDYDTYEEDFAPFVNMVQQSIMETTLVLIGFSGEDPNFEKWTKWVHNNLGEHMPKIYMLAYGEHKMKSQLNNRGITLIDFEEVYEETNKENVYGEMFKDIFEFLSYVEKKDKKDWPFVSYYQDFSSIDEALENFVNNRESYPGWILMPDVVKKRSVKGIQLASYPLIDMIKKESELGKKVKIINEMIWIYEKFHIPIERNFQNVLIYTIDKLNESKKLEDSLVEVVNIIIRLIKEARLEFNESDFNKYSLILEKLKLNREQRNKYFYEKLLLNMYKFNFQDVKLELDHWEIAQKDLEWVIKKAIILSKIGEVGKALDLLEDCLNRVRRLIAIKGDDYRLLSIEGIILMHIIQLDRHYSLKNSRNRLSYLESKLCNPLKELDFIYSRIKPYVTKTGNFVKRDFDPNKIIRTSKFANNIDMDLIDSYCLIMLTDDIGLNSNSKSAIREAVKNVEIIYPFYSWLKYLQIGSIKEIDDFFSRDVIYTADSSSLSRYLKIVMDGLENNKNTNKELLLEILSRLYFALSKEEKIKVDILVLKIFVDIEFYKKNTHSISKIFKSLFKRIIYDKNLNEKSDFFSRILSLPIISDPQGILNGIFLNDYDFFDPSYFMYFESNNKEKEVKIVFESKQISRLISILEEEKNVIRDAALARLIPLLESGNLEPVTEKKVRYCITNIIKSEEKDYSNHFSESYLIQLTEDFDLQKNYCEGLFKEPIPKSFKEGVITGGIKLSFLLQNLNNALPGFFKNSKAYDNIITNESYIIWLNTFFEWWDDQEKWLLENHEDDFFGKNDDLLIIILFLKNVFLPNIPNECLTSPDRNKLNEIYNKLSKSQPHIALFLIPVFLRLNVVTKEELHKISESLLENNSEVANAAISSIYDLAVIKKENGLNVDLTKLKSELLTLYLFRKESTILEATKTLKIIIHFVPDLFCDDEYRVIIKTVKLLLFDINNDSLQSSSLADQVFDLLAESAGLAGYIYSLGNNDYCQELQVWKEVSQNNRLPEVRQYAHLFNQ